MSNENEQDPPPPDDDHVRPGDSTPSIGSTTSEPTLALPQPPPPTPPEPDGTTFGPNGLSSGCRVILFLLVYLLFDFALYVISYFHNAKPFKNFMQPEPRMWDSATSVAATLLATLLFAWLERRRLGDYGLPPGEAFRARFWIGGLTGFAEVALFIGILALTGHVTVGPQQLHGAAVVRLASLWGIVFLLVGMSEELLMRGYMLTTLTRGIGFWPSAVATSLLFAAMHIPNRGETSFGLFQVFVFGMIASLMLRRTGSLWLPIGYHAFWDWGQSYFYGVADSGFLVDGSLFRAKLTGPILLTGGSVGPEGSIVVSLMLIATGGLVITIWNPARRGQTKTMATISTPDEESEGRHEDRAHT
jgi:membrane protease YdiL (CAAX protease family)